MGYENDNIYIRSSDLDAIERGLTAIFEREGYHRIPQLPPLTQKDYDPNYGYKRRRKDALLDSLRVAVIFPGGAGWTMMQTHPYDILFMPVSGCKHPRLGDLTAEIGCDAFQLNLYDGDTLILLEANADGQVAFSGNVFDTLEEIQKLIPEEHEKERFRLIEVPEQIQLILEDEEVYMGDQVEAIAALLCGSSFDYWEGDTAAGLVFFSDSSFDEEFEAGAHALYFQRDTGT